MSSIRRNFAFSLATTASQFILPIIILPYVARVLGASNLGVINFASMIASYFVLLTTLGMNIHPQREVSKCHNDKLLLSRLFGKYIGAQILASTCAFILFAIMVLILPNFSNNRPIFLLSGLTILASFASLEWLYRGLQLFNFLAWRALVARVFLTSMVFIFVKNKNDEMVYVGILVISVVIPNFVLVYSAKKFINFSELNLTYTNLITVIKQMWQASLYNLFTSIYSMIPVMIYGLYVSSNDFGVFSVMQKITVVILAFFGAFATVMYPKQSELIDIDVDRARHLIQKSFFAVIPFSFFALISLSLTAKQLVPLIFGIEYERGSFVLTVLLIQTTAIVISQVYVNQILLPKGNELVLLKFAVAVSVISIPALILMLYYFPFESCALSIMFSEAAMLILLSLYSAKRCDVKFPLALVLINGLTAPIYFAIWMTVQYIKIGHLTIPTFGICATITFIAVQMGTRNPVIYDSFMLTYRWLKSK